jgi:hypothetical protein
MDWQMMYGAEREAARNINGNLRESSNSTAGTGLGIVPSRARLSDGHGRERESLTRLDNYFCVVSSA